MEKLELSYTAGGNVKWYNHFGKKKSTISEEGKHVSTIMIWPFHSYVFNQEK